MVTSVTAHLLFWRAECTVNLWHARLHADSAIFVLKVQKKHSPAIWGFCNQLIIVLTKDMLSKKQWSSKKRITTQTLEHLRKITTENCFQAREEREISDLWRGLLNRQEPCNFSDVFKNLQIFNFDSLNPLMWVPVTQNKHITWTVLEIFQVLTIYQASLSIKFQFMDQFHYHLLNTEQNISVQVIQKMSFAAKSNVTYPTNETLRILRFPSTMVHPLKFFIFLLWRKSEPDIPLQSEINKKPYMSFFSIVSRILL